MQIIDTDILIDHFHGHQAALNFLSQQVAQGETLAISVVSITEFSGGMRPGEELRTANLLKLFTILDLNETIAYQAGAYLRQFRASHKLELGDALIAATAKLNQATLVTRNLKHYPRPDITVIAPYQRGQPK